LLHPLLQQCCVAGAKMLQQMLQHCRSMSRSIAVKTGINSLAVMRFSGIRLPPGPRPVVILLHCTI
jgi:hypothetical protein